MPWTSQRGRETTKDFFEDAMTRNEELFLRARFDDTDMDEHERNFSEH